MEKWNIDILYNFKWIIEKEKKSIFVFLIKCETVGGG